MYNITILGAYGSKSDTCGSSSFYLNEKHIIDAGNLLVPLKEKSALIETIWLTHSHLDHISDIAYILDNYYDLRTKPLRIKALKSTIDTLKMHFLNDEIWPDFSKIPLKNNTEMSLIYESIDLNKTYILNNYMSIMAFPTDHTVPSCGYIITQNEHHLLISADTYNLDSVIENINNNKNINHIVIECSFPSSMQQLAKESKHLTAELLFKQLKPLESMNIKLYINHLKPVYIKEVSLEIEKMKGKWDVTILTDNDKIHF